MVQEDPSISIEVEPQGAVSRGQQLVFVPMDPGGVGGPPLVNWDLGDGSHIVSGGGRGLDVYYAYSEPGEYVVTARISTSCGVAEDTVEVTVDDCPLCKSCSCPLGRYDSDRESCVISAGCEVPGIPDGDKGGGYFARDGQLFKDIPGADCDGYDVPRTWSPWLDRDNPSGTGDFEVLSAFSDAGSVCADPVGIQCRTRSWMHWSDTGEVASCEVDRGLVCRTADQPGRSECSDYEVRFCCP